MTYLSDRLRSFVKPKPRYQCEHVKAGFLTVARIDMENAVTDVCTNCYGQYQRNGNLVMTTDGKVYTDEATR